MELLQGSSLLPSAQLSLWVPSGANTWMELFWPVFFVLKAARFDNCYIPSLSSAAMAGCFGPVFRHLDCRSMAYEGDESSRAVGLPSSSVMSLLSCSRVSMSVLLLRLLQILRRLTGNWPSNITQIRGVTQRSLKRYLARKGVGPSFDVT